MSDPVRLAVLASHPIEQQGPFFKALAAAPDIDLEVWYCWKFGVGKPTYDPQFGRAIQWDIPLLDGYRHRFLRNFSPRPTSAHVWGEVNPGVMRAIWCGRHDVLLVHGWNSVTAWLAFFAAMAKGLPFYIRGENPLNQELLKGPLRRAVKRVVLGWLFRRAAGFFYIGQENRKFYEYYGVPPEKLHFVPYAVDNERFLREAERLSPQKEALKQEFGIDPEHAVILSLGKLIPKKRPMDLLEAYEKTPNPYKALVFVGDGPLRPDLERYAGEWGLKGVHFAGFRNQTEIGKFYALADIFAFPSQAGDTWGFVLNEAMCFGLPLVVSDVVGSVPDLVAHGENGFVFPTGDAAALARVLEDLVADPERRAALGRSSRARVGGYSYDVGVRTIASVLRRATGRP